MPRPSRWNDVVETAARLFSQKGFSATSLEDVAAEVGLLKGSLYNYIDSKEDLLFAVVRPPAEQLLQTTRELRDLDLPPAEKIRRATRSHAATIETYFPYVAVYVQEIVGRYDSEEWAAMDREYLDNLEAIIAEGIADEAFSSSLDPHIGAVTLVGALNWMTRWYRPGGSQNAQAIADQIADLFLAGALRRHQQR